MLNTKAAGAIPDTTVLEAEPWNALGGGPEAQANAVRSYFTQAGIPGAQILSISENEYGISSFSEGVEHPIVVSWFAYLHRGFGGVPIFDSMAWAMIGRDGRSLEEQVYWPEIDATTMRSLAEFKALLDDNDAAKEFFSMLPDGFTDGALGICHTSWQHKGPFVAVACYRINLEGLMVSVDSQGNPIDLGDQ
jgi:hypothetical protein